MQIKTPLASQNLTWPKGFVIGQWIEWDTHVTKNGRMSGWKAKSGRIVAINRWHATIRTGKYTENILLKDLYVGQVILKNAKEVREDNCP